MTAALQDKSAFSPEFALTLANAVDKTCEALNIPSTDTHDREVIAARIADLARIGVADPNKLRARVLQEAKTLI
jgi:hypothetical protein